MISDPKATVKVSVNDFIIKAVANALRVSFLFFIPETSNRSNICFLASTTNEWYL